MSDFETAVREAIEKEVAAYAAWAEMTVAVLQKCGFALSDLFVERLPDGLSAQIVELSTGRVLAKRTVALVSES